MNGAGSRNRAGISAGILILFLVSFFWAPAFFSHAWALTFQEAKAMALSELKPEGEKGSVIIFGLPMPLKSTQSLVEAGSENADAVPFIKTAKPVKKKSWLFWEDLAPYARFQHPSRILLIEDKTGKVLIRQDFLWYPLIDGKRPEFLGSMKAYENPVYRVYSNLSNAAYAAVEEFEESALSSLLPKNAFKDDCLISIGLRNDPYFSGDFDGMSDFASSVGLKSYIAAISGNRNVGGDVLKMNVRYLAEITKCKDIFIYISGHGYRSGTPAVQTGESRPGKKAITVTSADLKSILDEHSSSTFKIKIDSCFSGRFITELQDKANLLVIESASSSTEYSYSRLKHNRYTMDDGRVVTVDTSRKNPGRGEFTNGNIAGMRAFVNSSTEVAEAQGQGHLLARMIARAYSLGASSDAARTAGMTHPVLHSNLVDSTGTVTWHVSDKCNDGYRVDYKFYDFDNDWVWPGSSTNYYTPVYGAVYASTLKCVAGSKVCIGGKTGNSYWGVGLEGKYSCSSCCYSCDGQTHSYSFGCQDSGGGTGGGCPTFSDLCYTSGGIKSGGGSVIASCACPAGTRDANSDYTLNGITYRQCVCN